MGCRKETQHCFLLKIAAISFTSAIAAYYPVAPDGAKNSVKDNPQVALLKANIDADNH